MDEMKPLLSIGETLESYFMQAMLEQIKKPSLLPVPNTNSRSRAYYIKPDLEPLNPETHCTHCGHSLHDSDY